MTESLPPGEKRTPSYYTVFNTAAQLMNSEPSGNLAVTLGDGTESGAMWMRNGGQWVPLAAVDPSDIPAPQVVQVVEEPTGTLRATANPAADSGWALCQGQAVGRTDPAYSALFAKIGTTYGAGDGSTTFNVPDLRGRVPMGAGTGDATDATAHPLGQKTGTEGHLLTAAQSGLPAHSHGVTLRQGNLTAAAGADRALTSQVNTATSTDANPASNASQAHPNTQPSLAVNWQIKL